MEIVERITTPAAQPKPAARDPGVWFVLIALAGTTLLHYLTDAHLIPYHSIYRSLYYLPIAVAAVRYGRRGGIIAALAASALYIPHVLISWEMMPGDRFNDLLENVIFLFVGALAGSLADAERRQRQRAQEAAAQLEQQAALAERMRAAIESILESIDSGVLTLDRDGRRTMANRVARALLQSDEAPAIIDGYLAAGARGYRQVTLGGRALGLHGSPLIGAQGEPIGTVLVLDDLTEQRALEEQIQRAQRLAALGRLAGGLAHEIRNPLGITRAAAQMLQSELEANATLSEYTQVIQSEIDRVDRLVEQLLAYARPLPITRGPVDLAALLEHALTLTRAYAAQRGVTLSSAAPAQLPLVTGDAEALHQALVNLLLNGIQATPPGGSVAARAEIAAPRQNGATGVNIIISDTGHGIAPDDLLRIFDPFFTTRADGTGLGLSIVQQIVHAHSGAIEASNAPEGGARFILRLV